MSGEQDSAKAFWDSLGTLIEAWCDRRCFGPLAHVLPAYTAFFGLSDDWGEMLAALKTVEVSFKNKLPLEEMETIANLRRVAEKVVYRLE